MIEPRHRLTQRSFRRLLPSLLLLVTAATARGQTPARADSLPFHGGQWAAQFLVNSDFTGVGALRFRSPTSAWVLDGNANLHNERSKSPGIFGAGTSATTSSIATVGARFGLRHYHSVAPQVAAFTTVGLIGSYSRQRQELSATGDNNSDVVAGGLFGEVGGSYFLTPRLSLGAASSLDLGYHNDRTRFATQSSTSNGYFLNLSSVRVSAAIYF